MSGRGSTSSSGGEGAAPGERNPEGGSEFLRGGARPPTAEIVAFIDEHRHRFGVEPICRVLTEHGCKIAPNTYCVAKKRPPSRRFVRDQQLKDEIARVHAENLERLRGGQGLGPAQPRGHQGGPLHRGAAHAGDGPLRCPAREGLQGDDPLRRASAPPGDLVERDFTAPAPNRLWVADLTYVKTHAGWVYAAFILDVFSRMVVGWQISNSLRSDLAIDALEMAVWNRTRAGQLLDGLVHHSDRGVQYLSIRYSERLAENDIVASVGSKGG